MPKRRRSRRPLRGGSIVDWYTKHGPELHFRGFDTKFGKYSFAGPGTKLEERLNPDDTPKEWSKPVNRVDEAAYHHDLAYRSDDKKVRKAADDVMINALEKVRKDKAARWTERADATIVEGIMRGKRFLGLGKRKRVRHAPRRPPRRK